MSHTLFTVGKIVNTHGIRGELKIVPQTDFPEVRFQKGSKLLFQHPETKATVPVVVEGARLHKNMYMVKFEGFHNINEVEKYKGWLLKVSEEHLVELPEDEYYYYEIIGCRVVTDEGDELGVISEILSPGANDVWVVERPQGKPVLLPVIDEVLLDVDVEQKVVKVHLLEGLL
ncbi:MULTISPECIES: ribosome maturation factor RimM [unclassified Paenibacillus]|uniref:ribosome maturation factor RimM n=1 Tax=unclassified Paenibacillus TaxID=185978 RepID=UPI001C125E54|nr:MULTISPECIES: ribosome maturation factor RimM [unclassified Paenibacillus]MBU5444199.1 ribosome maturation factor RimM [Paenibacillus sp. MSJ-34]CAH0122121.1 Ribosome maturation factor RimM [Paenibacillus sp. CECT 9249]